MAGISKAEQFQKTQRILLKTARELFTQNGYADTSTEEIVRRSRVTRGALYYHYEDKADIFAAVFEEVRADSVRFIRGEMKAAEDAGADLWRQVIVGCHASEEGSFSYLLLGGVTRQRRGGFGPCFSDSACHWPRLPSISMVETKAGPATSSRVPGVTSSSMGMLISTGSLAT